VLDVLIAADGQPYAALQASPLEHMAAISRGHALAKAMHTHAPPDLRLIRTFGCHSLTSNKNRILRTASKRELVVFQVQ
jgi:hypothetical protein